MKKNSPIGIFDSGVGGLTVATALNKVLPHENVVYFGDTAHLPYGDKSPEAIAKYSLGIAEYLIEEHQAKAILMACNSASAVAYKTLLEKYGDTLPVINVIDPVTQEMASKGFNHVGVIGTRATISSNTYAKGIHKANDRIEVSSLKTPLLVPIIEEGLANSYISTEALNYYLSQEVLKDIEALILGCTHYPHIQNQVKSIYGDKVQVIDSPKIVAEHTAQVLQEKGLLNPNSALGEYRFFVSDYTSVFEEIAKVMFGSNLSLKEKNIWV